MRLQVTRDNVTDDELVKALSTYIANEHLSKPVIDALSKSAHEHEHEIIPEKYIRQIGKKFDAAFRQLRQELLVNMDLWIKSQSTFKKNFLSKSRGTPPTLTPQQVDELRRLIEAHFRYAIGLSWNVPPATAKKWERAGINKPEADLETWIKQSYVAGRLAHILENGSTYAEMVRLAGKIPLTRVDELIIQQAKQNAARFITNFGRNLAGKAEDIVLEHEKSVLNLLVQKYFSGDLRATRYNEEGLSPEEMHTLETDRTVKGWQELATELRARFKQEDIGRDWDRVAQSEIRYSTNLGRLMSIQHEGGRNPEEIEVYYHVQKTACKSCKKLYLKSDGVTPKIFKLSQILQNVEDTGGANVGLSASKIGKEGGWIPNALTHPNCHCYPVMRMKEYGTVFEDTT